jgi:tight adherence protein B
MTAGWWWLIAGGVALYMPGRRSELRRLRWILGRGDPAASAVGSGPGQLAAGRFRVGTVAVAVAPNARVLARVVLGTLRERGSGVLRRRFGAERDRQRSRQELIAGLAAIIDELRAGSGVPQALVRASIEAGRHGPRLRSLASAPAIQPAAATPAPIPAAGGRRSGGRRDPIASELSALRTVLDLSQRAGIPLADALTGLVVELRAARANRQAVQAAVAGPRASARMLVLLPAVGLAMGSAMGAHSVHVLLHTRVGVLSLCSGVLLDLAGLAWVQALIRRACRT